MITNTVVFGGSTSYNASFDLKLAGKSTADHFILNALQFNNSSAAGVTLSQAASDTTSGIRLGAASGNTGDFDQSGSGSVTATIPILVNVNSNVTGAGTGDISFSTLNLTGGNLTLSNSSNISAAAVINSSGNARTITNNIATPGKGLTIGSLALSSTATNSFTIGGSGTTTVNGVISETTTPGTFIKADTGTVYLQGANTFTGTLQVNNGALAVNSLADSGAGANGTGNIKLVNGANASAQLTYLGSAAAVTTRSIDIFGTGNNTSAIIDSSGAGTLTFGGASISGASAKTLVLQGSNNGNNTVAGVIADGTAPLGVTKSGAGTWVLSGADTYTGNTTVNAGTLKLAPASGNNNIAASPVINVATGATLDVSAVAGGFSLASGQSIKGSGTVLGPIAVATGAALAPGNSAGTLATASQTWGPGGSYQFDLADASGDP